MKLFIIAVFLFFSTTTFGQSLSINSLVSGLDNSGAIEGVIYDGDNNNEPLFFAEVVVKETNTVVTTNEKGTFKLNLKSGKYTLAVSFSGYKTVEITNIEVASNTKLELNQVLVPLKIEPIISEASLISKAK